MKLENNNRIIKYAVFAFIIAASITAYFVWKGQKDVKIVWSSVQTETCDIQILVTATGIVNAVKTVHVGIQASGVISKIFIDFNDVVKAGQVIALLDTRSLKVSLDEAAANF